MLMWTISTANLTFVTALLLFRSPCPHCVLYLLGDCLSHDQRFTLLYDWRFICFLFEYPIALQFIAKKEVFGMDAWALQM